MTTEEVAAHDALIRPRFAVLSDQDDTSLLGVLNMQMDRVVEGRDPATSDEAARLYHRALAALHECKAQRPGKTFLLVSVTAIEKV